MDAKLLPSVWHAASIFARNSPPKSTKQNPNHLPIRRRVPAGPLTAASDSTANNVGDEDEAKDGGTASASVDTTAAARTRQRQPSITPPTIRYVPRSKRRAKKQGRDQYRPPPTSPPPKKWEEMTLGEKAVELYVGEKGLLFWLNKIAYASIFAIIGGWILFRFVGPALNLYQLDGTLLSPDSVLKGS